MRQLSTHRAKALLAAFATLAIPSAALAATPVAVWDGDFSPSARTRYSAHGYTLVDHNETHGANYSSATIDRNNLGVMVQFSSAHVEATVLVKYSGLVYSSSAKRVVFATTADESHSYNRTGVELLTTGKLSGIWNSSTTGNSDVDWGTTENTLPSEGTMAFAYCATSDDTVGGTFLYQANNGSDFTSTYICGAPGLRGGNIYGIAVGGMHERAEVSGSEAAKGMTITGIAVFNKRLTAEEMNAYVWPSDYVQADSNMNVSALNTLIRAYSPSAESVDVLVSDGVVLTVDEAFDATRHVYITCYGSMTLSAASQPAASWFTGVDFSGVVKRSWLTPGVVGINFAKGYGNVTSSELVTSDRWVPTTGASGTSTDLFADGITKITWSSANDYSYNARNDTEACPFIYGYLDDGPNRGNGVELTIEGVPYETYDIVIYASTDTAGARFRAKTVNGTTYTVNPAGNVSVGDDVWGSSRQESPAYGINAMRVRDLSGTLTIYGGLNTHSSGGGRGGIAAIQIMPTDQPESEAILTLGGANANWSSSAWRNEAGTAISAPTSGRAAIVVTASSTLTIDESVSLTELAVRGAPNAVLTLVSGTGSIAASVMRVKSGVLKLGSADILDATPTLYVEAGGTLDLNSLGLSTSTKLYIAGAGAGDWPWALTSSSGAGGAILGGLYLSENATIGGANELKVGQTQDGYYCYLQGYTLTKTGAGAFTGTNMNTPGTGTIDMRGGAMSVNQWNNLNSGGGSTTLTLRDGASFSQNSSSHQISVHTLNFLGGTLNTPNPIYVASAFTGGGETARLVFRANATASLTRDLTVTDMTLDGAATFNMDAAAASSVSVRPVDTLSASSTITVGSGVVFDLGTKRPADATFAGSGIIALTLTDASETPVLKVANEMTRLNVLVYDTDGVTPLGRSVAYDSGAGTITVTPESLAPFIHYDFNAGNSSTATDSPYGFSFGNFNPTFVSRRNGRAARFTMDTDTYWSLNTAARQPFYTGQMTVTSLIRTKEANNTIIWSLGNKDANGIAVVAKDSSTLSLVSWSGGASGADLVSVTGIEGLLARSHLMAVVATSRGTTLYVDGLFATTDALVPANLSQNGQFASIYGGKKNYNRPGALGLTIDDWRLYDVALPPDQVEALCDTFLTKPFSMLLR